MEKDYKENEQIDSKDKYTYEFVPSDLNGYPEEIRKNIKFFNKFMNKTNEEIDDVRCMTGEIESKFRDCPGTRIHTISNLKDFVRRLAEIIISCIEKEDYLTVKTCLHAIDFLANKSPEIYKFLIPSNDEESCLLIALGKQSEEEDSEEIHEDTEAIFELVTSIVANLSKEIEFVLESSQYFVAFINFLNIMEINSDMTANIYHNMLIFFTHYLNNPNATGYGHIEKILDAVLRHFEALVHYEKVDLLRNALKLLIDIQDDNNTFMTFYTHRVFDALFQFKEYIYMNILHEFLLIINNVLGEEYGEFVTEKVKTCVSERVNTEELLNIAKAKIEEQDEASDNDAELILYIIYNKIVTEDSIELITNVDSVVEFCKETQENGALRLKEIAVKLYLEILKYNDGEQFWGMIDVELICCIIQDMLTDKDLLLEVIKLFGRLIPKLEIEKEKIGELFDVFEEFNNYINEEEEPELEEKYQEIIRQFNAFYEEYQDGD